MPEDKRGFGFPIIVRRAPVNQNPTCPEEEAFLLLKSIEDTLQAILGSMMPLPDAYSSDELAVSASTPTKPASPNIISVSGSAGYDKLPIYEILSRKSPRLTFINDGTDTIYVLSSTDGGVWSGPEQAIQTGEAWTFYNVYGLRVRSPTSGNLTAKTGGIYRVTEYEVTNPYVKVILSSIPGPKTIKTVTGTIAATATIVPAVAGKRIKVIAYSLITSSAVAVTSTFNDGAGGTALWTVPLQALAGTISGANLAGSAPSFIFGTSAGNALELALSAAQSVTYSVSYFDDDPS